jgi:hypothetical protein
MGRFLELHETPIAFREALTFSEAEFGFTQRLIEKDYFCSLVLADFEPLFASGLVFKGLYRRICGQLIGRFPGGSAPRPPGFSEAWLRCSMG